MCIYLYFMFEGGRGKYPVATEIDVQMRACNDCNYSQYCFMFLFKWIFYALQIKLGKCTKIA